MARRRHNPIGRSGRILLAVGGIALALYLAPIVYDRAKYGKKAGKDASRAGYLPQKPADLARAAGVDVETYSLGRGVRSEAGRTPEAERQAVAFIISNEAKARGKSITETVTATSKGAAGAGFYGPQNVGGRYVSTREAPRASDLELAAAIRSGKLRDTTGGARRFFVPKLQDRLVSLGKKGYTRGADEIIARWGESGYQARTVPGLAPRDFLVFVKGPAKLKAMA